MVFATLGLSQAADKDSDLAIRKSLVVLIHRLQAQDEQVISQGQLQNELENSINFIHSALKENGNMFSKTSRDKAQDINNYYNDYIKNDIDHLQFKDKLELMLLDVEYNLETYTLAWKSSFLLYILK